MIVEIGTGSYLLSAAWREKPQTVRAPWFGLESEPPRQLGAALLLVVGGGHASCSEVKYRRVPTIERTVLYSTDVQAQAVD